MDPQNAVTTRPALSTPEPARSGGPTTVPITKGVDARDRRWRGGLLAPLLFTIGSVLWLIGAALFVGSQERYLIALQPNGTIGSGAVIDSGLRTGCWVLWIIGSIFYIIASIVHLGNAFAQAAIVTVNKKRPGIARWAIITAWVQLVATILLLIGSCVWSGGSLGAWSGGAIVILAGYTLWGHALLAAFCITYVVSTVVTLMPDYKQRRYTWSSVTSTLVLVVSMVLHNIACILLVVRDPPGVALSAALLFLVAGVYNTLGWMLQLRGSAGFYTPVWAFATAAYATSGTVAAAETDAAIATKAGVVGMAAGGAAGAAAGSMAEPRSQLATDEPGMGMGMSRQPETVVNTMTPPPPGAQRAAMEAGLPATASSPQVIV